MDTIKNLTNVCTQTIKIQLYVDGTSEEKKRGYTKISDAIEGHALMKNQFMTAWYAANLNNASEEEKDELIKLYSHNPDSNKGSAYADMDPKYFIKGLPIAGDIPFECKQIYSKACKDGLMHGRVSLPTFSTDNPLRYPNRFLFPKTKGSKCGLYHEYQDLDALHEALMNAAKPLIGIHFFEGIELKCVLGNPHKTSSVRNILYQIFAGEKKVCDSFLQRAKNKLYLKITVQIPKVAHQLDDNIVVGVDLGLAVPLTLALNKDPYKREFVGSFDLFAKKRLQFQTQSRALQTQLKYTGGGHGRKKKLKKLEQLKEKERNWTHTQNHIFSKAVIQFALQNNAKYINMEALDIRLRGGVDHEAEDKKMKFYLRNWSFFELQSMIQYKAEREGIIIRFVEPAYTSQTCSVCGQIGERPSQKVFHCKNPGCPCHTIYKKWAKKNNDNGLTPMDINYADMDADFNGARNIAMSELFVENSKKAKIARRSKAGKMRKRSSA
jgi:IS605 OrfB family transposase